MDELCPVCSEHMSGLGFYCLACLREMQVMLEGMRLATLMSAAQRPAELSALARLGFGRSIVTITRAEARR